MSPSPTLKDLAIIPIEGTQWYSLGLRLGVQHDILDAIEARYSNPNRRKREMFKRWLDITPNPSWNTLLAALDEIGATEISECVQKEYDLPPPPSPPPPPPPPALQQREEDIDAGFVEVHCSCYAATCIILIFGTCGDVSLVNSILHCVNM